MVLSSMARRSRGLLVARDGMWLSFFENIEGVILMFKKLERDLLPV